MDWIKENIDKPKVSNELLLDIANNLNRFRKNTVFQTGVMAYIMNFYEKCSDYDELR
jgi:calcium-dependent protein kinase